MPIPVVCTQVTTFPSTLGWMALVSRGDVLLQMTFGHASEAAALNSVRDVLAQGAELGDWNPQLVRRLQAFAAGKAEDFDDVGIDDAGLTAFTRRVIRHCRRVGYGKTTSYGELAQQAGAPRAARAVGHVMATNRWPLIVPCHRVLAANAQLGGYSAAGGLQLKRDLLAMEAAAAAKHGTRKRRSSKALMS